MFFEFNFSQNINNYTKTYNYEFYYKEFLALVLCRE